MELETKVKRSLTELNYIINNMDESLQKKIPKDLRESIKSNMDNDYIFDIDISKKYTEQNFSDETKAMLSLLLSDYIGDDECKKKWKEFDKKYIEVIQKNINTNVFEKEKIHDENNELKQENQMVEYKAPLFKRFLEKILSLFRKRG